MKRRKRIRRILLVAILVLVPLAALLIARHESKKRLFSSEIRAAAERYGVDPLLVKAVVWRESGFVPDVRGRAGEIGLMQLREIAAQQWADAERIRTFQHEHCLDPGTNTMAGTYYLGTLLKRYRQTDDPIPYALADYNAGRGNVIRWNKGTAATNSTVFITQIGFPGTEKYVRAVMRRHRLYRWLARIGWS